MKKHGAFICLILAVLATFTSCKKEEDSADQSNPEKYKNPVELLDENQFQGAAFFKKGEQQLMSQGFGMADQTQSIPNRPELTYRIGSVTKSFTAVAVLHLIREGAIDHLDQTISDFDDTFPEGDKITIRHLLTHESGLPEYVETIEELHDSQGVMVSPDDIYGIIEDVVEEDGLTFEPGAGFSYCNSNYLILGLLIEALSGLEYHDYLKQKIFLPLDMNDTGKGDDEITSPQEAKGYANGQEVAPYLMDIAFSAGDLVSTLADLEKWGDALLGNTYLTMEEKSVLFAEPYTQDGVKTVGMGWFTSKENGTLMYSHGGDIAGFTSQMALFPEENGMLILLSNEEDKGSQREEITTAIAQQEF